MDKTIIEPEFVCSDIKCIEKIPDSFAIVIFGASGDLCHRKLLPALFNLYSSKLLPEEFIILGSSRTDWNNETFRESIKNAIYKFVGQDNFEMPVWNNFAKKLFYFSIDYNNPESYKKLLDYLRNTVDCKHKTKGTIFHLAIPPGLFPVVIQQLGENKLSYKNSKENLMRIVIEKPFGKDTKSAKELNKLLLKYFTESDIFRIDHYLGKETVQNILMFRFANTIFEPIWNKNYIDNVQISALETLGIENRAWYYEEAGVLRDMFQNHMLQLLALVGMEPPSSFDSESIRDEKDKVFRSIRPIPLDNLDKYVCLGQYDDGTIDGKKVNAYRKEKGVSADSDIETFAAVKFMIDNWRWKDVPFYLRSGKRLAKRITEIAIQFKEVPQQLFYHSELEENLTPNILVLRIQPDEGISLSFQAKKPGTKICMGLVKMDFSYKSIFGREMPEAYERLLLDCMLKDQMLFNCSEAVELCWSLITPVIENLKNKPKFPNYKAGSFGPVEADKLLTQDKKHWRIF